MKKKIQKKKTIYKYKLVATSIKDFKNINYFFFKHETHFQVKKNINLNKILSINTNKSMHQHQLKEKISPDFENTNKAQVTFIHFLATI